MTRYTPQWLQQGTYAASVDRRLIGFIYPTAGVIGGLVTVGTGMTVNIAVGQAAVPTANNTGTVLCSWDAVEQVTLPAAPAAGTNRYDLIIVQARGNDLDGGANNDFIITYVQGTAAASPTVPAVPANAVALSQHYIPGGSSQVTLANWVERRIPNQAWAQANVYARVHMSAQASPAANTQIPFNVATRDPLGMWSVANKRFTVPYPGHYLVQGCIYFGTVNTSSWTEVYVRRNGTMVAIAGGSFMGLNSWGQPAPYNEIVVCNAGDTIDLVWNGAAGSIGGAADGTRSYADVQYLHP